LQTIKKLRFSIVITIVLVLIGIWIGTSLIKPFNFPFSTQNIGEMESQIRETFTVFSAGGISSVFTIFWRNIRVLLLSFILGIFSFGILGTLPLIASVGVVGYLMSLLQINGIGTSVYLFGFILPHGIFEIPAAIIATAAVLYGGAVLTTPNSKLTIGEVSLQALADWCKLMVGVVIPLLLLAAVVEAWITPKIAMSLLFS
jgi:uncharacterized membrane protein SpoIIM required for sporulation